MARGQVTEEQRFRLARAISRPNMESIAVGYLGFDEDTVETLVDKYRGNPEAFNREVIRRWINKHQGTTQRMRLAVLLYEAAQDGSYVDARKVHSILRVSEEKAIACLAEIKDNSMLSETQAFEEEIALEDATSPEGKSETTIRKDIEKRKTELKQLADRLKPHTARQMKMEVFPWMTDMEVNMEEIYTDSDLEKQQNKLLGQRVQLEDYKDLFIKHEKAAHVSGVKCCFCNEKESLEINKEESKRMILIKGNPGMGKTSLAKKIAWDWATGVFTAVTIVFFVFLKLVRPGETIEKVIVDQNPVLEELQATPRKVLSILRNLGRECLLILDGLDEHVLGQNADVLKITKGGKLLDCNIILTSRPHSTRKIEKFFEDIVTVKGFTRDQAEKFCGKILKSERRIAEVLSYNPLMAYNDVHKTPILLSFLCFLVREDNIDLSNERFSTGEIYARMVRCLYKKFCIRSYFEYQDYEFAKVLKLAGKLALETLLSGKPLLPRSRVIQEVGEHAFDYGLLIGHEDLSVLKDEGADIFVTFPHRSIQEFLGAFYFIQKLNDGASVDEVLSSSYRKPLIFLVNPLFLHFCCWILYSSKILCLPEMSRAQGSFVSAARTRINFAHLNLDNVAQRYPALAIWSASTKSDKLLVDFVFKLLLECNAVKDLVLENDAVNAVHFLPSVHPLLDRLSSIRLETEDTHLFVPERDDPDELNVVVGTSSRSDCRNFLRLCNKLDKKLYVYIHENNAETELSEVLITNTKELHFKGEIEIKTPIKYHPNLTHLSVGRQSDQSQFTGLLKAVQQGNLPSLSHLQFERVEYTKEMHQLLSDSSLTHLSLNCRKVDHDLEDLSSFASKLEFLAFSEPLALNTHSVAKAFQRPWMQLTSLSLYQQTAEDILDILNPKKLPLLSSLSLERCMETAKDLQDLAERLKMFKIEQLNLRTSRKIAGKLSLLLGDRFASLDSLNVSDCQLTSEDLMSLAQAKVEGRLPKLKHLNLHENYTPLHGLFEHGCKWEELLSLSVTLHKETNISYLDRKVQAGCLMSLRQIKLDVYYTTKLDNLGRNTTDSYTFSVPWYNLKEIGIKWCRNEIFDQLVSSVEAGNLPALRIVYWFRGSDMKNRVERLRKHNICIYRSDISSWN